jgi:antirestriction protein ArdC
MVAALAAEPDMIMSEQIHHLVTQRMIAALERGTIPWRKPWQAATGQPRAMSTGQPYRGVNVFLLALTAAEEGYASPFWGTYRQIAGLGGQVRRGGHSTLVVFFKRHQVSVEQNAVGRDEEPREPWVKTVPVLRYFRVFNAAQADHLPDRFYPASGEQSQIDEPQTVLNGYLARGGPRLLHVAGDRADYHPATDTIRLPLRAQFRTPEAYYATAFHEAGHSTGHPARLNRPGIAAFDHFGSGQYAREELIAQMTSSLMCAQTGIDTPDTFTNSASYIGGWLHALNDDKRLVITAAACAQRASDLINPPERQLAKDGERHPKSAVTADEHVRTAPTAAIRGRHQAKNGEAAASEHRDLVGRRPIPAEPEPPPHTEAAATKAERARAAPGISDWQAEAG